MDISAQLKVLIQKQKETSFIKPEEATDEDAFGLMISHYFHWSGLPALKVCYAALEDSNFHGENETIQAMIDKLEFRQ